MAVTVQMEGISKRFGDVQALAGVDFDLFPGEVHALLGENGAGKTTLMNILYGTFRPDTGSISVDGSRRQFDTPGDAIAAGIDMVHQHFMLVPTLTVAENMVLGESGGPLLRKSQLAAVAAQLRELGEHHGLEVDPEAFVWELSVGEQQRVEILRALYRRARILILDEPTATLTPMETERLFPRLRALVEEGVSIVLISHHLEDVLRWADRISVLRNGAHVGTVAPGETSPAELARMMVGRDVKLLQVATGRDPGLGPHPRDASDGVPLKVSGLKVEGDRGTTAVHDASFTVGSGEIVAIAGVEGNGQPELEEALFGLREASSGEIRLEGRDVTRSKARERMRLGLGLIPSDRYRRGLIRELPVAENLVFDRLDEPRFATPLRIDRRAVLAHAEELIERFSIRVSGPQQLAGTLSGGNAQRLVLARALSRELRCLVAAQPTRGLDVGAIEFVWEQLAVARDRGVAILLISTELDEVMSIADRCFVIYRGRLIGGWGREQLDRERVGLAMGGSTDVDGEAVLAAEGEAE